MSTRSVDEGDVAGLNDLSQVLEQPRDNPLVRSRSRNICENNADPGIGPETFAARPAFDRTIQRPEETLSLVVQSGHGNRFDDVGSIPREIDLEKPASIGELNSAGCVHIAA